MSNPAVQPLDWDNMMELDEPRNGGKRSREDDDGDDEKKEDKHATRYPTIDEVLTNEDYIYVEVTKELIALSPTFTSLLTTNDRAENVGEAHPERLLVNEIVELPPRTLDAIHVLKLDVTQYSVQDLEACLTAGHAFGLDIQEWLNEIRFRYESILQTQPSAHYRYDIISTNGAVLVELREQEKSMLFQPQTVREFILRGVMWWKSSIHRPIHHPLCVSLLAQYSDILMFKLILQIGNLSFIKELHDKFTPNQKRTTFQNLDMVNVAVEYNHLKLFQWMMDIQETNWSIVPPFELILCAFQFRRPVMLKYILGQTDIWINSDIVIASFKTENSPIIDAILSHANIEWDNECEVPAAHITVSILERLDKRGFHYGLSTDDLIELDKRDVIQYWIKEDPSILEDEEWCLVAAHMNRFDMLKYLFGCGFTMKETNPGDKAFSAISCGNVEMTNWLMEHGVHVDKTEDLFWNAVCSDKPELVQLMIDMKCPLDVQKCGEESAVRNNFTILKLLEQHCGLKLTTVLLAHACYWEKSEHPGENNKVMIDYLTSKRCPADKDALRHALFSKRELEFIQRIYRYTMLMNPVCEIFEDDTDEIAIGCDMNVIQYLHQRRMRLTAAAFAVQVSLVVCTIDDVRWFIANNCPMDQEVGYRAFESMNLDIIRLLIIEHHCPYNIARVTRMLDSKPQNAITAQIHQLMGQHMGN
jgi:hypothetical protein